VEPVRTLHRRLPWQPPILWRNSARLVPAISGETDSVARSRVTYQLANHFISEKRCPYLASASVARRPAERPADEADLVSHGMNATGVVQVIRHYRAASPTGNGHSIATPDGLRSRAMAKERRFDSPRRRRAPARTPTPTRGPEIWRLRKGDQVMTCELQIDTHAGPWVDVQLLRDGQMLASLRFVDKNSACHIAQSWRKIHAKAGWTESSTRVASPKCSRSER
jgi:hypothetical protein